MAYSSSSSIFGDSIRGVGDVLLIQRNNKYIVYDDNGKLVIMTRDGKIAKRMAKKKQGD